jgi:hypothetical protein
VEAIILQVLLALPAMSEPAWLQAAVAIRLLFPPPGVTPAPHPGPPFFDAVATLLAQNLLTFPHLLHALSGSFSELSASVWTGTTFDAAMKSVANLEPPMRAPTATGLQIELSTRDCELERSLGHPPPVLLLLSCIRLASWATCTVLIDYFAERKVLKVAAHRAVGLALLERVAAAVAPMHEVIAPNGPLSPGLLGRGGAQLPKAQALPDEVVQMLEVR